MIRAIVFDCFGVLAEDGWSPFKRQYLQDAAKAAAVASVGKAVDEGRASYDDMIRETARIAGVDEAVVRVAVECKAPNEPLFEFIRTALKPRYKIGMLSNASYNVLDRLFMPEQVALFDATALSYEMGLVKPDPAAYRMISERLGVASADCLLVDDKVQHSAGALNTGIQAVQYESLTQLKQSLAEAGVSWE